MARIRTIKPEFWSSPDVGDVTRDARLLFIAIWNFADDAGRIDYIPQQLASAAFPFDDDVTADQISAWTQELVDATLVAPYQLHRRRYLQVTGWEHQRINRPSSPRCPDPGDGRAQPFSPNVHGTLSEPSTDPISPKKERRSVGASERRNAATPVASATAPEPSNTLPATIDDSPNVQALVAEHIDAHPKRPPGRVIGHIGHEIKLLADEGWDAAAIRAGLALLRERGLHPSTLASCVNERANSPPDARNGQLPRHIREHNTRDQQLAAMQAELEAQERPP